MALVSGMGEAVLPYGDGIASESGVQDGATFGGKAREIIVKEVRFEKAPLSSGDYKAVVRAPSRERQYVVGVESRSEDLLKQLDDARGPKSAEPAPSMHGKDDGVRNGHVNGLEGEEEEGEEREAGPVANGGSHMPESGSAEYDHLVEMVIQCLDEKVDRGSLTEEALELLRLVPEGYIPLPHQVGGHRHVDGKLGFIRKVSHPEVVYKPVQPGIKGHTEVQFYESLFGSQDLSDEIAQLRELIPFYFGRETIQDRAGHLHEFLKLEDITHRFKRPCIMDLKVGRRVWDDFAEQDKIERERKKYPAQETLGYRIIGMRVYQPSTGEYVYYDKFYGRSITEDRAMQAISNFFVCGESNRRDIIPIILKKLESFLHWFQTQTSLRLFATSLLIVYEGDHTPGHTHRPTVDIRLVDFAHTYECAGREESTDINTLFGLENFTQCLTTLNRQLAP